MILENYKTIFVHIPKTGGGTVELRLGKQLYGNNWGSIRKEKMSINGRWSQHFAMKDYQEEYKDLNLESFYKFCFVRNPWDRAVSEYLYMIKMKGCNCSIEDAPATFSSYVKEGFTCSWGSHVIPQSDYILDEKGKKVVDDVFKFEDFENEFNKGMRAIGIKIDEKYLGLKANVTRKPMDRAKRPYWKFYDKESRDIVAQKFSKDISLFGYDFT